MKRTYWTYILPVILLLAVTLPHLDQGNFKVETPHYGAIGLQAWRNPALFWTLHEHPSVPYFNKPPLVFWIHGLFLHLFGITLAVARIPAVLAATGCVLLTTLLARRLMGRISALAAGCILALSYEFFRRTREISLDMWQLFFMLGAVTIWVFASSPRHRHRAWLAGIPLGLALLCKPLTALLVPVLFILWHFTGDATRFIKLRDFLFVLLGAMAIALPWHLSMMHLHGETFIQQYFGREIVQRMQGLRDHQPIWYYAVEIGRSYWPWMLLLGYAVVRWARGALSHHHRTALTFALAWLATWSIGIHLSPDKRPRYALPLYPMLAIICAYGLTSLPWKHLRTFYRKGLGITAVVAIIAAAITNLLPIRFHAPPDPGLSALIKWADKQNPETVYAAALSAIDASTLYLEAGYWPTPLSSRHHLPTGSLLIYSDTLAPKPAPDDLCVFQAGSYRVMRK